MRHLCLKLKVASGVTTPTMFRLVGPSEYVDSKDRPSALPFSLPQGHLPPPPPPPQSRVLPNTHGAATVSNTNTGPRGAFVCPALGCGPSGDST